MTEWKQVEEGVYTLQDSCRVYAVRGGEDEWLVINAGTDRMAGKFAQLGAVEQATVLLTHHFRDHTAGGAEFRRRGAKLWGPWYDREHLAGAQRAMSTKQILFLYDLAWDHFAPLAPLAVDRWMMDYERIILAGLTIEVVPTPAFTLGAVSYVVTLAGGRRLAFVGELMCAPGKVGRISPLQYNYNDLTGMENVLFSWDRVMAAAPDLVLPSMGEPFGELAAARSRWLENAARFEAVHPGIAKRLHGRSEVALEPVAPRIWRADGVSAETHFITGRSGRVLALDYGYDTRAVRFPMRLESWTRRPLLHSLGELRTKLGAPGIDTVIATHYHDDHVVGLPLLQRLHGCEVWAGDNFASLLERPQHYDRPCLWPEPIRVTRRLPLGEPFKWDDITVTLHPMSGHTEFSTLVCLEIDGLRVAHTGDQLFYLDPESQQITPPERGGVFSNHVYRNGLALGCYVDFVARLRAFAPALILSGHHRPYCPDDKLWGRLEAAARAFDIAHAAIMPLGPDDVHFGADSVAGKITPSQMTIPAGGPIAKIGGWVLNPLPAAGRAWLRFSAPDGLRIDPVELVLGVRARTPFSTTVRAAPDCPRGRHLVGLELEVRGKCFGHVVEAWVEVQ